MIVRLAVENWIKYNANLQTSLTGPVNKDAFLELLAGTLTLEAHHMASP